MKLTLRHTSLIPLELHGVTPAAIANLSELQIARLPVLYGNRRLPLGEFFDGDARANTVSGSDLHIVGDTRNVHGIGAHMDGGFVYVEGDVGRHTGAQMVGGRLLVDSNAGDWLGAEMTGGSIEVRGSVGHQAGAAYRGSRRGMRGGMISVLGNAGDELGLLMRRGTIVVRGPVGEFAGASMIAGSLFLLGGAGGRLGAGMKRGTIVVQGAGTQLPPTFPFACRYRPTFLALYAAKLRQHGHEVPAAWGTAPLPCHRGDLLHGGRGEVFLINAAS